MNRRRLLTAGLLLGAAAAGFWFSSPPSSLLACREEVYTVHKTTEDLALLARARERLEAGEYAFSGSRTLAVHMPTLIGPEVTFPLVEKSFVKSVGAGPSGEGAPLEVRVEIVENDIMDPGKKFEECKKAAGHLLFSYRLEGEEVYRFLIEFMSVRGLDVPERVDCAVRSFKRAGE